jgi:Tfp pilus assembly PilM family ATPase
MPLGVDIGHRRVRIALLERSHDLRPKLMAVAARDYVGDPGDAITAALTELQTNERRCILALGRPDAALCTAAFPPMPNRERRNAALFEVARFLDYPISEAAVSLVTAGDGDIWVVGAARRTSLAAALGAAKKAHLRPLAVDDAGFALLRAHPEANGIIDIGDRSTRLICAGTIPFVSHIPIGGSHFTEAIAHALGLDRDSAEERKRDVGFGGAGDEQRDGLILWLTSALAEARHAGYGEAGDLVLCGNGSRVAGLAEAIRLASGARARAACLPPEASDTLPADVLRAAAADWSLAYGLALWAFAA